MQVRGIKSEAVQSLSQGWGGSSSVVTPGSLGESLRRIRNEIDNARVNSRMDLSILYTIRKQ